MQADPPRPPPSLHALPRVDPGAPLQFVINGAAGSRDADAKRALIEGALRAAGRDFVLRFCRPAELPAAARAATAQALAARSAVVAVGGDGTLNTVAQAAHAAGCAMGVLPLGTFNYFARSHGIAEDPAAALQDLLRARPAPVQVAAVNGRVFLVNASLGLYPELLEDREAYKARFGRSRGVAVWAAIATLLRAQRRLRLRVALGGTVRHVRTLTLFVGNNRLQLEQLGMAPRTAAAPSAAHDAAPDAAHHFQRGRITALVLRPIGTLPLLRLLWHGALGTLGEADSVERFEFNQMRVEPSLTPWRRGVKVAYDGEVEAMPAPLEFRVLAQPLFLLKPPPAGAPGAAA